jgi:hypothetical protein
MDEPHFTIRMADELRDTQDEVERLQKRMAVLEMIIREELEPDDCACEVNKMIVIELRKKK